jgi:hypothetical protein
MLPIIGAIVVIGVVVFVVIAGNKKRKGERLGEDTTQHQ